MIFESSPSPPTKNSTIKFDCAVSILFTFMELALLSTLLPGWAFLLTPEVGAVFPQRSPNRIRLPYDLGRPDYYWKGTDTTMSFSNFHHQEYPYLASLHRYGVDLA